MSSTIEAGLRADRMRKRMEDKNTLSTKGSIYVGLGTVDSDGIAQTDALQVGNNGQVLVADSGESKGVKWADKAPLAVEADHAASAANADNATNVSIVADNTLGNNVVKFNIGTGAYQKTVNDVAHATRADQVGTQNVGDAHTPIYLANGTPTSTGCSLRSGSTATTANYIEFVRGSGLFKDQTYATWGKTVDVHYQIIGKIGVFNIFYNRNISTEPEIGTDTFFRVDIAEFVYEITNHVVHANTLPHVIVLGCPVRQSLVDAGRTLVTYVYSQQIGNVSTTYACWGNDGGGVDGFAVTISVVLL